MKKLLLLLVAAALGVAVYRRLSGSQIPAAPPHTHRHGTPDHWPPVVRKPGAKVGSTAPAG